MIFFPYYDKKLKSKKNFKYFSWFHSIFQRNCHSKAVFILIITWGFSQLKIIICSPCENFPCFRNRQGKSLSHFNNLQRWVHLSLFFTNLMIKWWPSGFIKVACISLFFYKIKFYFLINTHQQFKIQNYHKQNDFSVQINIIDCFWNLRKI